MAPRLGQGGYDRQQSPHRPPWIIAPTSWRFRLIERHVARPVPGYASGTGSLGILVWVAESLLPFLARFVFAVRGVPIGVGMKLTNHLPTRWWCRGTGITTHATECGDKDNKGADRVRHGRLWMRQA